jgi:hypothetical protein
MTDMDWVKQQLTEGKVTQPVGTAVLRLFEVWDTMTHTAETAKDTIDVFAKLALGHALVDPEPEIQGQWVAAHPGFVKVADTVRVKADAFDGSTGTIHNGRVGRVVAVRSGNVIINSTDGKAPKLEGAHYSPFQLEKLFVQ